MVQKKKVKNYPNEIASCRRSRVTVSSMAGNRIDVKSNQANSVFVTDIEKNKKNKK